MDDWMKLILAGVAALAWMEYRFQTVRGCREAHKTVDEKLLERQAKTHELRGIVQPLTLEVAIVRKDVEHLSEALRGIAEHMGVPWPQRRRPQNDGR